MCKTSKMSLFRRYNDIENASNQRYMSSLINLGANIDLWVITEKVHGANFSFIVCSDGSIECAKRTSLLKTGNRFYNFQQILSDNRDSLLVLFSDVENWIQDKIVKMIVYGEIFGGYYPHPDIPSTPGAIRVQREIHYCPNNRFYAFDIFVLLENNSRFFVDFEPMHNMLTKHSIFCVDPLFVGSLEEALQISPEFQTQIPIKLGLPEIENNPAEGVVIKPFVEQPSSKRWMIKNKAERFTERSSKPKVYPKQSSLPQYIVDIVSLLNEYITDNRLKNVLSKTGTEIYKENPKNRSKLIGMFAKDIFDDFRKDNPKVMTDFSQLERKLVSSNLNRLSAEHVCAVYEDILNDKF